MREHRKLALRTEARDKLNLYLLESVCDRNVEFEVGLCVVDIDPRSCTSKFSVSSEGLGWVHFSDFVGVGEWIGSNGAGFSTWVRLAGLESSSTFSGLMYGLNGGHTK